MPLLPSVGGDRAPKDHKAWSLGQASSGRSQWRRQRQDCNPVGHRPHNLGLVLHLLTRASTKQRKPIY